MIAEMTVFRIKSFLKSSSYDRAIGLFWRPPVYRRLTAIINWFILNLKTPAEIGIVIF